MNEPTARTLRGPHSTLIPNIVTQHSSEFVVKYVDVSLLTYTLLDILRHP